MSKANALSSNEILSALAAYKSGFWSIGVFTAIINLLMLAPAIYMLQVYDRVLASSNQMTLLMLTLLVLGLFVFMGVLEWVRSFVVIRLGTQMDMRLNQRVYTAAFEASLKNGSLGAGQALNDLTSLRQFATGNALFAFFDAPWFPIYLMVIFLFHPWLGAMALAGAVLLVLLALLNQRVAREPLAEAGRISIRATQKAGANLRNAEVIEAMGILANLRQRWLTEHRSFLGQQNLASERTAAVSAWSKGVRLALQSLMLGLGALLAVAGEITPGMMIAGSILIGRVLGPLDQLIAVWGQWSSARQAYERLDQLLQAHPPREAGMNLPAPRGELRVESVSACAPGGRVPVLSNIGFALEAGDVLGILGPSGCGKSSLARLLVAAQPVLTGKVRLDGADMHQWDKAVLGPYIGYLPQDVQLFAGSIAENIARFGEVDAEQAVAAALEKEYPSANFAVVESSSVNPVMGRDFFLKCLLSVLVAALLLIVYIAFRFKKIGGASAGTMAIIALLHDVAMVYFTFVIFRMPINDNFIAVVLTILGYSLNDTIIIYDRIRENRKLMGPKADYGTLVDTSINQTLTRSLYTAGCTFAAIAVVYIVSVMYNLDSVQTFALPMMVGIITGCYSSVCVAGPLYVMWQKHKQQKKQQAVASSR